MEARRSRIICFMIAFILLFSGMCSAGTGADSGFVRTLETTEGDSINKSDIDFSYAKACTNKMISGMRGTIVLARRAYSRLGSRVNLSFIPVNGVSLNLFFYFAVVCAILFCILCSETAILNYIHKQDGEK